MRLPSMIVVAGLLGGALAIALIAAIGLLPSPALLASEPGVPPRTPPQELRMDALNASYAIVTGESVTSKIVSGQELSAVVTAPFNALPIVLALAIGLVALVAVRRIAR